jgi:hypothetical protein
VQLAYLISAAAAALVTLRGAKISERQACAHELMYRSLIRCSRCAALYVRQTQRRTPNEARRRTAVQRYGAAIYIRETVREWQLGGGCALWEAHVGEERSLRDIPAAGGGQSLYKSIINRWRTSLL